MRTNHGSFPSERGFSLLELLFALLIAVEILVAGAIAFDVHNKMAVVQSQVTDLQQSLRIAQYDISRMVRLAGRGGLPAQIRPQNVFNPAIIPPLLNGLAIEVRNNVADGTDRNIARGDAGSPLAVAGTDILILRGCFSTPVYHLGDGAFTPVDGDGDGVAEGQVDLSILNRSSANINQPLAPLIEQLAVPGTRSDLIIMSPLARSEYGIARVTDFDPTSGDPDQLNLETTVTTNSPLNPEFRRQTAPFDLVRGVPGNLAGALACLLEEYRYYIREVRENPLDATSALVPRLTRARFEPGSELPFAGDAANFSLDLADGIFDLQVALGFDSSYPAAPGNTPGAFADDIDTIDDDDSIFEAAAGSAARETDDWLFNSAADDVSDIQYREHTFATRVGSLVQLHYVRVTTVARTSRPDRGYRAPDFDATVGSDWVEDNDYDQAPANVFKSDENRRFRRRMLTTIIDPRNI